VKIYESQKGRGIIKEGIKMRRIVRRI